jgi:glycosyltransferase involved in cell wall biosynthesis
MLGWLVLNPYQILHVHVSAMDKFLVVGWFIYFSTMKADVRVITIHSGSFVQKASKRWPLARWISAALLRKFDHIITVNEDQKNFLKVFFKIEPRKIHVIPAFIRPSTGGGDLPEPIKKLRDCSSLVVGSGCATSLYAHEILLEAVSRLQDEGLDIALVVAVYSKYEEPYFSNLKERIRCMSKVFLIQDMESEMFNRLLELADVYVRTARRDGDSVAVREALFHGCHVVASNCIPRPTGCEIFVTDNVESLYSTLKRILRERAGRNVLIDNAGKDYAEDIISIYGL